MHRIEAASRIVAIIALDVVNRLGLDLGDRACVVVNPSSAAIGVGLRDRDAILQFGIPYIGYQYVCYD